MEFAFEVAGLQGAGISVWDAARLVQLSSVEFHKLRNVLEDFGQRSAAAQGLRAPITDIWRLRSSDQRLYLQTAVAAAGCTTFLGGLKIGRKKLFIHRANGAIVEVEPLCVLDFYVHESYQRQGVGKALFEHMLEAEQTMPEQLAYDRPSPKLLSFLKKHYKLCSFVPQSNNFVVFEQYFDKSSSNTTFRARLGNASSCSNTACGGSCNTLTPYILNSMGNGRQNIHIIGTAAAASVGEDSGQQWVPTSIRPPTPSLKHCVQLQAADVSNTLARPSCTSAASPLTSTLGGPGCSPAGVPTYRPDRAQQAPSMQQMQQALPDVQYTRGVGFRSLDRGDGGKCTGPDSANTFKGYEQALLGAANKPAPPLLSGMNTPLRDSLDHFKNSFGGQQQQQQPASCPPWAVSAEPCTNSLSSQINNCQTCRSGVKKNYSLTTPYSSWEPQPGSLLPAAPNDADRVSLWRQEEQQMQQRLLQQQERWQAMGAGPPGHLLAAPTNSYAVPTVGMAEVIGSSLQQQQQLCAAASNLSWDGLPVNPLKEPKQQQVAAGHSSRYSNSGNGGRLRQRAMQPGQLGSSSWEGWGSRAGSGGGLGQGALEPWENARTAAASHRAGSGAASCLRMV